MIPAGRHTDWPWPLSYIPRRWTAFEGDPPVKLAGNTDDLKPIPDAGNWILLWPFYFAVKTEGGWYFRVGIRWDDVDLYYNWPAFKIGKY